jgi:flagellar protein FlaG
MAQSINIDSTQLYFTEPVNRATSPELQNSEDTNKVKVQDRVEQRQLEKSIAKEQQDKQEQIKGTSESVPREELEEAIRAISDFISMPNKNVNFAIDDSSEKTVIKVFDTDNKELLRQFPSEEVLEIAQRIVQLRQDVNERSGILLDEKV